MSEIAADPSLYFPVFVLFGPATSGLEASLQHVRFFVHDVFGSPCIAGCGAQVVYAVHVRVHAQGEHASSST